MHTSGKIVILGIVGAAVASAAASWWFRYSATHRAAQFWGPEVSRLIRDAPVVELCRLRQPDNEAADGGAVPARGECADVSRAQGLTHLRNALLEDRSFRWPPTPGADAVEWRWQLVFHDDRRSLQRAVFFSTDGTQLAVEPSGRRLSCAPISAGLLEMFEEMAPQAAPR